MLVRAHHGRVEVASKPGEGSTFTILLPVWDEGRGSG
jgi:signal transduction histidine kinase